MEKVCKMFQIISQKKITEDIFSLWIEVGDMVKDIRPGQFVSVYCGDGSRLLPRPISICEVAKATKAIRLVYRVVGEGTKELSMMKAEEEVKMILPLGNGYTLKEDKAILIAGGIGIPPMLQLAKELKKVEKTVVLGFKDSQTFLLNEFSFIPLKEMF